VAKYEMTCTCGDAYQAEGETKEAAVDAFMGTMTPEMLKGHMAQRHAGQTPPTPEQARDGMLASARQI